MRFIRTLVCALLLPLVGIAVALPAQARDGGGDKARKPGARRPGKPARDHDFVKQLTAEELELLKKKLPDWNRLDKHKQNRIAMHVLRLREMDAAGRKRFQQRMERMREFKQRRGNKEHREHPSVDKAALGQAVESMLAVDWPEGLALADQRKWSRARLMGAFLHFRLMRRIHEFELQRLLAEDFDFAELGKLPEGKLEKIKGAIERVRNGDKRAGYMLGGMMFHLRLRGWRTAAAQGPEKVAEQVRKEWGEPYAMALADVRKNVDEFVKRVETPRGSRGPMGVREWFNLIRQLEDMATRTAKSDPTLSQDANGLLVRILRDKLELPADQIEALPPHTDPMRRRAAWGKLLSKLRGRAGKSPRRGFGNRAPWRKQPGAKGGAKRDSRGDNQVKPGDGKDEPRREDEGKK